MPLATEPGPASCWILTDGKAGDIAQCAGIAEALSIPYEQRTVAPRRPFSWFLPFGPIDPREASTAEGSPLAPPFPDLVIASGRRAVGYLKHLKRASKGRIFTVCLKDPRTGPSAADLIWVPEHDRLRGTNVIVTPTAPHRFAAERLKTMREDALPEIDRLPAPHVAVLVGGDSRHHRFTRNDVEIFASGLRTLAERTGGSLLITSSRRTPGRLIQALADLAASGPHLLWDGRGPNPLSTYLAKADAIVATADSTNMIGEAAATGRPIHIFRPSGGHRKIDRFLDTLSSQAVVAPFPGPLKTTTYEPLDATPAIAARLLSDYSEHLRALTP